MKWLLLLVALVFGCAPHGAGAPQSSPAQSPGHRELTQIVVPWESQTDPGGAGEGGQPSDGGAPFSLTASDGTGLKLVSLAARAAVEGPLAFTELRFAFVNPEARRIEGTFEITLPPGASVSRFAMRLPAGWQEGEVVERDLARRAYEDFLHRRVDPALLERQAGNRFRARVFPIQPSEQKEIILSYSQELVRAEDPYRLPLRGLPEIESLDVELLIPAAGQSIIVHKQRFAPDRDFVFPLSASSPGQAPVEALRHDRLAVARVTPIPAGAAADPIGGLVVLFDTSASRALGFRAQVERLGEIVRAIREVAGGSAKILVACFDQEVSEIFRGEASQFGQREVERIVERGALGASDLTKALRWAASLKAHGARRLLVVTDGVVTAGEAGGALRAEAARLRDAGIQRLDALVDGGIRDEALLSQLVSSGLPRPGAVVDAALPPARIARKLAHATRTIRVDVPGSAWSWPPALEGVQEGDQALIYAEIPADRPFEIALDGGERRAVPTAPAPGPLLERASVEARIRALSRAWDMAPAGDPARGALRAKVVDLSTRHRVLSNFTGLLVLETEADYARYKIDRRALTDVLVVGARGVELKKRPDAVWSAAGEPGFDPWADPTSLRFRGPIPSGPAAPATSRPPSAPSPATPVNDADRDGLPDANDQCPAEPETFNGREDDDGCPDTGLIIVQESSIVILQMIHFTVGGAQIRPESLPIIEAVAEVMRSRPDIQQVEIGGHTDNRGIDAANKRVSEARASAVRDRVIQLGVEPERLVARGYGEERPIADNASEEGRAKNRRVEFRILKRDESAGGWAPPKPAARPAAPALEGKLLEVMTLLGAHKRDEAIRAAEAWRASSPGDALALIALGEAREAAGDPGAAARAYGSLIDLYPSRADMRRYAGARLDRLALTSPAALALAIDTYRKARDDRPDHPSSHRLLAFALVRGGQPEAAFDVIAAAARRGYTAVRFPGAARILRDDIGLIGAAWARAAPDKRDAIAAKVKAEKAEMPAAPSLRFVLTWETDVGDVDFHIEDGKGHRASYGDPKLASGGRLYADVTTGYGPECFTIEGAPAAYPYRLKAHVFARGPMGYAMGKVEVIAHDGRGGLTFDERPFVAMNEGASLDLGSVTGAFGKAPAAITAAP